MKRLILLSIFCLFLSFGVVAQNASDSDGNTTAETPKKKRTIFRATKQQVTEVQNNLTASGSYKGTIDGKFNKEFRTSIKAFQAVNELKKTGTLNRATLEKMGITLTDKQKAYPVNPNSYDTSGNDTSDKTSTRRKAFRPTKKQITAAQTRLKDDGKFDGEVTGKYSKEFRADLKEYQSANELKKTGRLDRATLEKMGIALTDKQKADPVNPNSYDTSKNDEAGKEQPKKRAKVFRPTKKQITAAQTRLKDDGKFEGEVTGKYNPDFRASLKDYQVGNELKKTGRLDRATLEKMDIQLTKSQLGEEVSSKPRAKSFRPNRAQITEAQTMLNVSGAYKGAATGRYNKEFRTSVKDYQKANGLKRKGSLNRATLEKMGIELTDKQKEIPVNSKHYAKPSDDKAKPKRTIFRATKAQIIEVQQMLRTKGLYEGEDTGKLNPATRAGIREWQSQNGVKKTGTLNKVTLEAMGIVLTEKQKAM